MFSIRRLARTALCVCWCVCVWTNHLYRLRWNSAQRVIIGLSVTRHLWWASTINIYDALNQPHTEHCDSNHPSFLISPSRSILISISSAWWSHAVCWTSPCSQRQRERAAEQNAADAKLNLRWNVCCPTSRVERSWCLAPQWQRTEVTVLGF